MLARKFDALEFKNRGLAKKIGGWQFAGEEKAAKPETALGLILMFEAAVHSPSSHKLGKIFAICWGGCNSQKISAICQSAYQIFGNPHLTIRERKLFVKKKIFAKHSSLRQLVKIFAICR